MAGLSINEKRVLWELSIEDGLTEIDLRDRVARRYIRRGWAGLGPALERLEANGLIRRTSVSPNASLHDLLQLTEPSGSTKVAAWKAQGFKVAARHRLRVAADCLELSTLLAGGVGALTAEAAQLDATIRSGRSGERRDLSASIAKAADNLATHLETLARMDALRGADQVLKIQRSLQRAEASSADASF